ncbi:MAG TPA: NADH dehydrogenase (quinone) subunit D [Thermodesulfobacteriota bacterium]|nr:NADH dehydrogenase (quinone) subunit D [Thermodesulfobacteriota bacterium]
MMLHLGPQHPSTHGVLRVDLELDGEVIVKVTPYIGYLHRGIEKLAENKTYHQVIPLTDRLDYTSPMVNNLGYVLAVEKLLGLRVPERSQVIRVIMAELTRIQSHLIWMGTHVLDIGAMSPIMYCFREREQILDIFEMVAGARMNPSYIRVGGVNGDLMSEARDKIAGFTETFPKHIKEYEDLLTNNPIWINRTKGVGKITAEEAINLGTTGPTLRSCGFKWDLRKTNPYSGYENYKFDIILGKNGDVYDRYQVRIEEMKQSIDLIKQGLEKLKPGPIYPDEAKVIPPIKEKVMADIGALIHHFKIMSEGFKVPEGEVYQAIETPRGELGFYIVSDGSSKPYRVKIKTPSFMNLMALETLAKGRLLADIVAIIGSMDICLGEVDK